MNGRAFVYRFGDSVAAHVASDDKGTAYLTAEEARKLATALLVAANSVDTEKFTDSKVKTFELNIGA
jgi:hypothetical protein